MCNSAPLLFLLAALAAATRLPAADTDCLERETSRKPKAWVHPIPPRESLPKLEEIAGPGAHVLLDETVFAGSNQSFTMMAMVGSQAAADKLRTLDIYTGYDQYAEILARVLLPDGQLLEMERGTDITCSLTRWDLAGVTFGKTQAPKHYILTLRGLVPGAVLQYQIVKSVHKPIDLDWNYWYSNLFSFRHGSLIDSRFSGYAADQVSFTYQLPKGMVFEHRILNDNRRVRVRELPLDNAFLKQLQFSAHRGPLHDEPHAARAGADEPYLVTFVRSTEKTPISAYKLHAATWEEWVTQRLADDLLAAGVKGGAGKLEERGLCPLSAAQVRAACVNRYLRDRVTLETGNEIRLSLGFRPPAFVLGPGGVANNREKMLVMVATLRQLGIDASPVYARAADAPPMVREFPLIDWFWGGFLVAVDADGRRVYYDPSSKVASGSLPGYLQGGEALVVKDRKTFEWVRLPLSDEIANGIRAGYRAEPTVDGTEQGAVRVEWRGELARQFRNQAADILEGEGSADQQRWFVDTIHAMGFQGASVSAVSVQGLDDPDQPVAMTARMERTGALVMLGATQRYKWLALRPGPARASLTASRRTRPFDFRIPLRFEVEIRLPPPARGSYEPLPKFELAAEGLEFRRTYSAADDRSVTLLRTLVLRGLRPPESAFDVTDFLQQIEESDMIALTLRTGGRKGVPGSAPTAR